MVLDIVSRQEMSVLTFNTIFVILDLSNLHCNVFCLSVSLSTCIFFTITVSVFYIFCNLFCLSVSVSLSLLFIITVSVSDDHSKQTEWNFDSLDQYRF